MNYMRSLSRYELSAVDWNKWVLGASGMNPWIAMNGESDRIADRWCCNTEPKNILEQGTLADFVFC